MERFKPDFNRLKKVLLRLGEPDIVPFYELFADGEIMQAVTGKPVSPESTVEFYYKLGYDFVSTTTNFSYEVFRQAAEDTAALNRGKREFVEANKGIIENRADFDSYKWPEVNESVAHKILQMESILPEGMKSIVMLDPGGVLENVMMLMGYVPLSYALYEDEQLVYDIFEKIGTDLCEIIKTCFEYCDIKKIGAIALGDDMGFNHSTMISPEHMKKYVFPWQKKIVDIVHNHDIPVILHSCGQLNDIMDDLINYVGIDAKHSFEDKILPVAEAKKKYGNRIALLGGVDIHFLCTSSEGEIRKYVDNVIEACAPGGGYAFGTGNSVANYIPVENYLVMLDEGRRKGRYPII